ncbi:MULTISPECIES: DNA polymerase IV [Aerococcus]|uniref:DNA polymerase IV n=1 Tax=Aerococcus sanguinicola TaxID=119206 RepID=A0A5N1GMC9_9LACT|nr:MULTISPECIES: DNA polymerase IV [Aerococcus]KAA9302133.1 DNA polymerase IV [Aerococcus sanguinicola]MDK6368437.1 DNA polymerase IV [Aerococcus sp. UMB9870]MDK6679520.1 DNA polymerase IV [Aerococcus sp. UMB8608]MDK6686364.1 DNA polymerase IV [Aerococcus sp. UMB8623]MDK6941014.1 DNA polymerase IV [Aerococcus sp. UMB8487]
MRTIGILEFEEPQIQADRKILHVDMDAFYASIEQRDEPRYQGKPLVIARHPKENSGKGVVATASYEARKFGIHSAMSAAEAYRLCPQAIFVPARHSYYREVSAQVREIFSRYTDLIEPLSIDEAFLDVTENKVKQPYAMYLARDIQETIYQELRLTASIGVSYNKFLAKLASDYRKPGGMTVITPKRALAFLDQLPVDDFYGIGKKSAERLHARGVHQGSDLRALSQEECLEIFGKLGLRIYERVRGVDDRPVRVKRQRKSISKETTLYPFLYHDDEVRQQLQRLAAEVSQSAEDKGLHGLVVTLKFRYPDFATMTRQRSLQRPIYDAEEIAFHAEDLWEEYGQVDQGIRLLGVGLSELTAQDFENLSLPLKPPTPEKQGKKKEKTDDD